MKFEKIHLDDIVRCYCASSLTIQNQTYALFASENPQSECYSYTGKDFSEREVVWKDRGGCMSIIPLPFKSGEFLAVNEFYLKVTPSRAKLVHGRKTEHGWEIQDVLSLPYLHRFDIYSVGGIQYLICATIARNKQNKEDWSEPGQIYVGVLPDDLSQGIELKLLMDGCYRNHGYCRGFYRNQLCGYFASDQGILRVIPPQDQSGEWEVGRIFEGQVGEAAFADIDGDGIEEMMTIEPFHGNQMKIYKWRDHRYVCDYVYPHEIDFAHALIGTNLNGKPCFVGGVRRVQAELFVVQFAEGTYQVTTVETGAGPANIAVLHRADGDYILSANHTKNEAAVYKVVE